MSDQPKQRRGFALLSRERRKAIASLGGKASHAKGTGHTWTKEEASRVGRLGGLTSTARKKAARGE